MAIYNEPYTKKRFYRRLKEYQAWGGFAWGFNMALSRANCTLKENACTAGYMYAWGALLFCCCCCCCCFFFRNVHRWFTSGAKRFRSDSRKNLRGGWVLPIMAYAGGSARIGYTFQASGIKKSWIPRFQVYKRVGKSAIKQRTTLGPGYHRLFMGVFRFWSS